MTKLLQKFTSSMKVMVFLYCFLAVSTCLLIYSAVMVNSITYRQSLNYNNHLRYHIANDCFRQGTDLLTEAVRRYVVTMRSEFIEQYFDEALKIKHRDKALRMIRDLQIDPALKDTLRQAMEVSKNLMSTEYHAMHLIALKSDNETLHSEVQDFPLSNEEKKLSMDERHKRAEDLLWDDNYIRYKTEIYAHLARGLEEASRLSMARHLQLRRALFRMLTLSAISLVALVLAICGVVFYRRYQHEQMVEEQARESARMNAKLKAERDKSIQAEKAKSYFFSTVSHDIRTPLNSIIGFTEMLQLGIDDPEEKEKALDAIITSGQTLLELINDVLDLSKLESGKMELHPIPTDVASLIGKVAAAFETATSRSSLLLRTEVEKMPFLKLDPQRIRQILFNLIGNAVKFTTKGSITIRASYKEGVFTLSVTDTGCGISQENIGKLMSPYVQLQEHDSTKGTGLGLAICKQLSKQMNGTLQLESTLGKGSTFTLTLPGVTAFSEQESAAYFSRKSANRATHALDESILGKHILVVDDQKLNQKILQAMLTRLGFPNVLAAGNGREALEVLHDPGHVDIVLTDMSMPVMDGAELVAEIRKSPELAKIPVYVITADVEMQNEYIRNGFDDMLIKPITMDKLKELLGKYAPHTLTDDNAAENNPAKA
ncbi:MAG: response regulator [Lentisphaeria bacterium]|nr:response regulator [Lentisphaeria bacterium]